MAGDALDASKMNMGGKVHDTVRAGKVQKLCFNLDFQRTGIVGRIVFEEGEIRTASLLKVEMQKILSNRDDFHNKKPRLVQFLE